MTMLKIRKSYFIKNEDTGIWEKVWFLQQLCRFDCVDFFILYFLNDIYFIPRKTHFEELSVTTFLENTTFYLGL